MGDLYQKLETYSHTDYYPYHMPGHKRRLFTDTTAPVAGLDITEIEGFDNLHDAEGILRQLQQKAAAAYGAEESFYLVNGSTAGILSAISAALPYGGKLLMVRGCHKAVYHAVYLRGLEVKYLWTGQEPKFGCSLPATAAQVEEALLADSSIQAVLLVSPTYEGLTAEVAGIAEAVHKRGIPLIVDEAHGAHLGFHSAWPENSCRQGADLVVQSLHKTLPSLTQTAILHVNGQLIDRDKLKRFLRIYQSSSPSYLLMAAMEEAIDMTASGREELFGAFLKNWTDMLHKLEACECLAFLQAPNMDIGKLSVADRTGRLTGAQLYEILLRRYHLQMEMAAGKYVLAMFTIGDTVEGYERLTNALLEIDRECRQKQAETEEKISGQSPCQVQPPVKLSLKEAWDRDTEKILLVQAKGRTAGEFINLYPPGIPMLVPGEAFTEESILQVQAYEKEGLTVQGIENRNGQIYVKVLRQ